MLSRDYISRIIRTFFDSLELIFTGDKEKEDERKEQLEKLYTNYFGQFRDFFLEEEKEKILEKLSEDDYFVEKCGMLGEILYREFQRSEDDIFKVNLAHKIVYFYNYVNDHSTDYSLVYVSRILELENYCKAHLTKIK
ncbi:hypothetical protein [uncultured Odoribacter sp.]|uniref:hypothetical protein n=1 Tax=uncultured Odoribacter sp. TaxID=876416 RepID=UPI00260D6130|nr:hypothetical protein [uncultured Odoribacter sp.]